MRSDLMKSMEENYVIDMIYLAKDGVISQRRIKVLQIDEDSFRAYCCLRKSSRIFKVDNILALVPIISKERVAI